MFIGKFITIPEFAFLEPIDVFHREGAHGSDRRHPEELKNLQVEKTIKDGRTIWSR